MMTLRRRQHMETNKNRYDDKKVDNTNVTLIDEDEQETMIQQLRSEYQQQSDRLEYIFIVLCRFIVPLLSFLYTIVLRYHESSHKRNNTTQTSLHHLIQLRWIHLILNILIHWNVPRGVFRKPILPQQSLTTTETTTAISATKRKTTFVSAILWYGIYLPYFLTLLVTAMAHWMIRQQAQPQAHYKLTEETFYCYYHSTLFTTATIFILSAWYIQYDRHDYVNSRINELQSSKYEYKSL